MPSNYKNPLKKLKPIHLKIIQLYFDGLSREEISKEVGLSVVTISKVVNDRLCKKYMRELQTRNIKEMVKGKSYKIVYR